MVSASQAAKFLCRESGWSLTNLQLQKLLYLAHMTYMGENNGNPLINNRFEAWDFGPVVPDLYHRVKTFGSDNIGNVFRTVAEFQDHEREDVLEWTLHAYSDCTPGELVNITHWRHGAWYKNYIPGARGIAIPNGDIVDEYERRSDPD